MNVTIDPESARRLVRESYDRIGRNYAIWAASSQDPVRKRYLELARKRFPEGSRLLDLGCGDGSQVTAHLAKQHDIIGVDISPVQIQRARLAIPEAQFICADMTSISFPEDSFDGILAFYCLTHIPQPDLPGLIRNVYCWLRPGGLFIASMGTTNEPGSIDEDWLGAPMFFSGCETEVNRQILIASGLLIELDRIEPVEEFERTIRFHWIIARKPPGRT